MNLESAYLQLYQAATQGTSLQKRIETAHRLSGYSIAADSIRVIIGAYTLSDRGQYLHALIHKTPQNTQVDVQWLNVCPPPGGSPRRCGVDILLAGDTAHQISIGIGVNIRDQGEIRLGLLRGKCQRDGKVCIRAKKCCSSPLLK